MPVNARLPGWWSGEARDYPGQGRPVPLALGGSSRLDAARRTATRPRCARSRLRRRSWRSPRRRARGHAGDGQLRRPRRRGGAAPPGERARDALRERLGRFGALVARRARPARRARSARLDGFLTGAERPRRRRRRARLRARQRRARSGSTAATSTACGSTAARRAGGVEHLRWEQRYRGIPVADAELEAAVTGAGRLHRRVTGPAGRRPRGPRRSSRRVERRGGLRGGAPRAAATPADVAVARPRGRRRAGDAFADGGTRLAGALPGRRRLPARLARARPGQLDRVYDALVDARTGAVGAARQPRRLRRREACSESARATAPQVDRDLRRRGSRRRDDAERPVRARVRRRRTTSSRSAGGPTTSRRGRSDVAPDGRTTR